MKPLRECPTSSGQPSSMIPAAVRQQGQIVLVRFAKSDARIQADPVPVQTVGEQRVSALSQISENVLDDVAVPGIVLHVLRRALHVHGAHACARFPGDAQHPRVALQAGHVIDDLRTGGDRFGCHHRFRRVDRNRNPGPFAQGLDDGQHAAEFLGGVDRCGVGPRAFATHIQYVRPLLDQTQAVLDRFGGVQALPAVGKTVRRHVNNSHQQRSMGEGDRAGSQMPRRGPLWKAGGEGVCRAVRSHFVVHSWSVACPIIKGDASDSLTSANGGA